MACDSDGPRRPAGAPTVLAESRDAKPPGWTTLRRDATASRQDPASGYGVIYTCGVSSLTPGGPLAWQYVRPSTRGRAAAVIPERSLGGA